MKRKGISLTALTIGVVILFILLSTVSISVTYSINNAKKRTFAEEIYNIQKVVDEYIENEGELPLTKTAIQIQVSDETQFNEETIVDKKLTLEELDLVELGIKNTVYGNKEDEKDIYAISQETGRVYYITGFKAGDKTYYTLTDDLLKMVERNQDFQISEKSIVFTPSTVGWSKEGVSLVATVPSSYTNPSIQIDNGNIVFNTTVQDGVTVYTVNQAKLAEEYTVTIKYTKDGQEGTTSYIAKIDNIAPAITKDTNVSNTATHIKGIKATDNESGIKYFKYAEGAIDNDTNIKVYMSQYGKDVNKGSMKLETIYTLYAEDKAGNYSVMYIDKEGNIVEKITYPTLYAKNGWNKLDLTDSLKVTTINIVDEVNDETKNNAINSWTADEEGSGEIMCYFDGATLTIAGNGSGKIMANENSSKMFYKESSLANYNYLESVKKINGLEIIDTSKVTDMSFMFYNSLGLENVDLSSWDTSRVTNMNSMFREASALESVNLRSWKTSNVTDMRMMFLQCESLTQLDVSSFDTTKVYFTTTYENGLKDFAYGCNLLTTIFLGENFGQQGRIPSYSLFYNTNTSVLLKTTVYNANNAMKSYAWGEYDTTGMYGGDFRDVTFATTP